jgi:protein TonB
MSSVVDGDSAVAVPVGNTLLMKPAPARKPGEAPQPYAGTGAQTGATVSEVNVATLPRVVYEVNSADNYPADAKALGIEGKVKASLTLNEKGQVVGVRILERAGHGFDEAATQALRKFRFSPALTNDGRAVPFRLTFEYRFSIVD